MKNQTQVWAVMRTDRYCFGLETVTIKEIVGSEKIADQEVERLDRINGRAAVFYWKQPTRWVNKRLKK